jgi:hypothetical protein
VPRSPKRTWFAQTSPQGWWKIVGEPSCCVGNQVIGQRQLADFIDIILCSASKATILSDAVAFYKITQRTGVILLWGKEPEKQAI